ncbi:MAG: squalene/phytoene synthase family protein [Bryobacteraceae bacterium]
MLALLDLIQQRSRPSLLALMRIYSRLLERIERSNYDVLRRRISLPVWEKLSIVGRALAR